MTLTDTERSIIAVTHGIPETVVRGFAIDLNRFEDREQILSTLSWLLRHPAELAKVQNSHAEANRAAEQKLNLVASEAR